MEVSVCPTRPETGRLILLGRLQDAEDDHDTSRRSMLNGVIADLLEADKARWSRIGSAIAALAHMAAQACAISAFGESRPRPAELTIRLSEAIDDQFDREVWRVVDAAARLAVGE